MYGKPCLLPAAALAMANTNHIARQATTAIAIFAPRFIFILLESNKHSAKLQIFPNPVINCYRNG